MTWKRWVLLAVLLALAPAAHSQPHPSSWRIYRTTDGLTANNCISVAIGPRGKVWVSHSPSELVSGLDGYNLTNIAAPVAFRGRVYESAGGQIWLVCNDGLEAWIDGKWSHYPVPEIAASERGTHTSPPPDIPLSPVRLRRVLFLLPDALMQLDIQDSNVCHTVELLPASRGKLEAFSGMTTSTRDGWLWITGRRGLTRAGPARALGPDSEWHEFLPPPILADSKPPGTG